MSMEQSPGIPWVPGYEDGIELAAAAGNIKFQYDAPHCQDSERNVGN